MCDCIEEVEKRLADRGLNTKITLPDFVLNNGAYRPKLVVEKVDKNVRKKPIDIFVSFCPFCGIELGV